MAAAAGRQHRMNSVPAKASCAEAHWIASPLERASSISHRASACGIFYFTWDFARRGDVVKVNLFYFVPLLFSLGVGALLYRATGNWNIADVLAQSHSAALGHLFLIVAVIAPLASGWYSGAFALSHLTPLRPNQSTLLICLLGFLLAATRFDQQLLPFLTYLSAGLGPALVLMLLIPRLKAPPPTGYALGAWLAGAVAAVILRAQGQPLDLLVGMGVSLAMLGGLWVLGRRRMMHT